MTDFKMSNLNTGSAQKFTPNFDFLTLKAFLEENLSFLQGARIQKIQQPTRQELIFHIRGKKDIDSYSKQETDNVLNTNQGESRKFYINTNPQFFHLCFISKENEEKRMLEIPKSPPMFCMLLRKYLESAKIAKVSQPKIGDNLERILEFYFETYNELSEKIYLCLAIELMGKHSNVVLYNYDTNIIIGCLHNVGAEKSSVRELIGGLPYAYPPKHNNKIISGFSKLLEGEKSINDTIDNYFAQLQESEKTKAIKAKLLTLTKAKMKKVNTALTKVAKQSKTQEKADLYRKKGDLIMAGVNIPPNKEFLDEIEIIDWESNLPVKIKLDTTKTLQENANTYYKMYKKAKTANLKSQEIIENLHQEEDYLNQVLYSIESAQSLEDFLEIQEEIGVNGGGNQLGNGKVNSKEKIKSEKKGVTPLTFKINDFTIYVGKNNKQNDYIVSKLARDEDIWFHVHNYAGSHVLLKIESGQKVDDKIIFECAKLAKEYSAAKNTKVGVIYTKRKYLKKPTGANLGYVTYKNEKEIIIN